METPPRTQMASYLERWEEQKAQSRLRRLKEPRRHSSDVGDELSFISAIERENAQQERYDEAQGLRYTQEADDSFDLPAVDVFLPSELALQTPEHPKMPADDEFVDAATFIKKNELGGDDSFSEDVGALAEHPWDQLNSSGRPSDFFESKSRNLDHVELSSPRNIDDPLFEGGEAEDEAEEPGMCTPKQQQSSPTDLRQGVALHDRFDRNSGLSGSGTAFSSGYDVNFDNTKLMYTPNSLKYLQEKSRFRGGSEMHFDNESNHSFADHTGEAETVTKRSPSLYDPEIPEDPSPEYVAALQRGPGVIKESLHEIDALIDNSIRLASSPPTKDPVGVELPEDVREFVRDYERPLESMLPLSRTTDSWGEDISISQIDDNVRRRSRELERLSNGTEPSRQQTVNGVRRSRSQETPELDTIRETPSNTDSASRSQQSAGSRNQRLKPPRSQNHLDPSANDAGQERRRDNMHELVAKVNHLPGKHFSGGNLKRSNVPKSRATSATLDQSLAEVAATQNPFRDEMYRSKTDDFSCASDEERGDDVGCSSVNDDYDSQGYSGVRVKGVLDEFEGSESDGIDPNSVRFRYGEKAQQSRSALRKKRVDDQRGATTYAVNDFESTVPKQPVASDRLLDVLDRNKLHVAMEAAMIPRRCRRFLCSVGDIMTEQVVFTNGTNSVGRICVSLLPLSTGCQQFSVSPAVLELGPKASSAFHVSFNARYAGAVSGIFQFRGVGIESLFHPYEVVIEASVKRRMELEVPRHARTQQREGADTTSERVQELQASSSVDQVEITPTFIRFDRVRCKSGEKVIRKAKLRLSNNTAQTLPFKVRALENLRVRPATGMIQPASEVIVSVLPISQPFVQQHGGDTHSPNPSPRAENWFGSVTVRVGKEYLREVSVVVDRRVIQMLPPFDEIARSQHQLSSQTDSFYYTKHGKRRGLYFHARAVEFGCCNVGESHEVPVYVCNGSMAPMTVFLQDLQEPFSCAYATTTIEPRKFIEVMVTFTPKVVGKVATSLFAYSVSDKAVVTLVARGI
ncbi:hypothetical protein PHYPSEUDO_005232 [Phytophthora pseudosyringae]|uniref:Abnormal spindle-like microcephaly-associated protein ASH domain-containing protein n=1 Tax=Phytophthora pseudosyringae TaxID=221518 RepID=A0A8T1WH37_9STRA|nr:hypothetical protein PHYPSEUDO_005232 [Phytophthora pseudosyringae]